MSNKAMATVSKLALAGLRHGAGAVAGARRGAAHADTQASAGKLLCAFGCAAPLRRHAAVVEMALTIQSYCW